MFYIKKIAVGLSIFAFATVFMSFSSSPVVAAGCDGAAKSFIFINPWTSAFKECKDGSPVITDFSDFFSIIFWAVESLLKIASYVALAFVIWGGIKYIKSQGDPGSISDAKSTIIQALGGFVVALAASGIVQFISGGF